MNTYLELPDVENLQLSGFNEAKVQKLYWVEDYVINDPMYYEGLKLKGDAWDSDQTNQRYRDVNENKVDGGSEITRTFDINTSAEDRILTFTNTPKQDVPIHKEAIKTNYIIIPNQ